MFDTSTIGAAVEKSQEAEHLSLIALQSNSFPDAKAAQDSIDISLDALDALDSEMAHLRNRLRQHRAQVSPTVSFVHNATLPVMRLLPDLLPIIITELARIWRPDEDDLGWIQATHVCAEWRRALLGLAPLWAGELGVFWTEDSFHEILRRAQDVPLTVVLSGPEGLEMPEYYWDVLSKPYSFRAVDLVLNYHEVDRLFNLFRARPDIKIDSLTIGAEEDTEHAYFDLISLPTLRSLSFDHIYAPFQAPNLVALSLVTENSELGRSHMRELLNALELCKDLAFLQLSGWTAVDVPSPSQTIRLPRLRVLKALGPEDGDYIALLRHFELPALGCFVLHDRSPATALSTISSIFDWLLADKHIPPCISNISDLIVHTDRSKGQGRWDEARICLDDGSTGIMRTCPSSESVQDLAELSSNETKGVFVHVYSGNDGVAAVDGEFVRGVVARCVYLCSKVSVPPVIRSAHFDLGSIEPHWDAVLRLIPDVEALSASYSSFHKLFLALAKKRMNGTMPLPRLTTIFCKNIEELVLTSHEEQEDFNKKMNTLMAIMEIHRERRKAGVPVFCKVVAAREGQPSEHEARMQEMFEKARDRPIEDMEVDEADEDEEEAGCDQGVQ